ncbi:MAG: heterodisulfide reductase-related iron-sulfur binding cluster [Dehalococcoidia bacterium]
MEVTCTPLPCRDTFWNIGDERVVLYIGAAIMAILMVWGISRWYRLWLIGKPEYRANDLPGRLRQMLVYGLGQRRTSRDNYAGLLHSFIYGSFIVLTIITIMESLNYWGHRLFNVEFLNGPFYLVYSLFGDIFGVVLLVGVGLAVYRRAVLKASKLEYRFDDRLTLVLFALVALTGFLVESPRIAITETFAHPEWAIWSPVSYALSFAFVGLPAGGILLFHKVMWFTHLFAALAVLSWIGYSKMSHILFGPLNIFFFNPMAGRALRPIDDFEGAIERGEPLGVAKLTDFTWKQLLDSSACIKCGRCHAVCPATASGKPLSPKNLILDIRYHLLAAGPGYIAQKAAKANEAATEPTEADLSPVAPDGKTLVGEVITDDVLWSCTTCRACMEECPMFIEHIPAIVDMRRNLVMMESRFSPELQRLFNNLESAGNPWRSPRAQRADWAEGLGVKILAEAAEGEEIDVLYWVGCAGSFDERNQKVARSFARTMQAANVNFAILGREESCNGDPARRCGNEYLFQLLAQENIATLNGYNVKNVVTACAHCYNTIKNEYPQFGGQFNVMHHTEYIDQLIKSGRIQIQGRVEETMTYHDPCYIGRHNGVYDAPREVLNAIPGLNIIEMPRTGRKAFCCGGGGGHSFFEVKIGTRINHLRTQEALDTGSAGLAAACPYCNLMFEDGVKVKDAVDTFRVRDIAELVDQAIQAGKPAAPAGS